MKIKIILTLLLAFSVISCSNKGQKEENSAPQQQNAAPKNASASMDTPPGKKVYDSFCLACHMADGSGVPGMHPPLIQTDWVTGDKERLIKITLEGMSGKIEVNGEEYNSIMPPYSHLSDKQIADVLTYVRKSFGNDASAITVEEVQKVRNN